MTSPAALPTRRDEEWRYSDMDALAALWPLPAPEHVVVPAGGNFSRTLIRDAGGVAQLSLSLGKQARAAIHVLNIGGHYGRVELDVTLHEGADFVLGGVQLGGDEQTLEIISTVRHVGPDATSRQVVRSVLAGHATGTCLGKVAVARGADGTDAEQSVRAMLLDRTATANAKPELEIYADDVKCAHGCAVGELDANGLFYLQARGLSPAQARQRVARFIGGAENEIVFTRGATEAINLVANSWGASHLKAGDRILLSVLEHHSNIVPWQLLRERIGIEIDVCPLTEDGCIDLDAAERMLTPAHRLVALAHVSNVLGSMLDVRRAAALAHSVGAKLLVDGCQAVPRLAVDVAAMDCDFYVFSAHKLYGPTGIGALWARAEILGAMPPWHGGGSMIDRVTFEKTTFAPPPARFEAGTPAIVEAIALAAAIDYVEAVGIEAIHAHEMALVERARAELRALNAVTLFGPEDSAGIVSFALDGVHPHDLGTILDEEGVAIRAGHHCAQPLMDHLGVAATARASFGIYNDENDIDALLRGIERTRRIFG